MKAKRASLGKTTRPSLSGILPRKRLFKRLDEAREMARQFLLAVPQFTISSWAATLPFRDPRDRQHFIDGYLMAGLPI